jgi:hypothetical protein
LWVGRVIWGNNASVETTCSSVNKNKNKKRAKSGLRGIVLFSCCFPECQLHTYFEMSFCGLIKCFDIDNQVWKLFFCFCVVCGCSTGWPNQYVKNSPKCSPTHFCHKYILDNFYRENFYRTNWEYFCIFHKTVQSK